MINLGVKYLLPEDWKCFAWVDADIDFDSIHWASDTLKLLHNGKDFVQLFTHAIDMDFNEKIMNTFTGFGYQYCKNFKKGTGINYWHPGFAWACNRKTYEKIGGLLEVGILGSGDNIMCHTFIQKAPESLKSGMTKEYKDYITNFQNKMYGLKLGYVPGTVRHYFHGKKENRNYYGREDILINHKYNPYTFITTDPSGLIIPTDDCPKAFLDEILQYFYNRNEDEMVVEEIMSKDRTDKEVLEYKINFILHEFEKLKKKTGFTGENTEIKVSENKIIPSLPQQSNTNNVSKNNKQFFTNPLSQLVRPQMNFNSQPLIFFKPTQQMQTIQQMQQAQMQQAQMQQAQMQQAHQAQQAQMQQAHQAQQAQQLVENNISNNILKNDKISFNEKIQLLKNIIIGNNNHYSSKHNKLKKMSF